MRTETVMGAAMKRAGGPSAGRIAFRTALALFLNNGGTIEEAQADLDAAREKMRNGGQRYGAGDGRKEPAAVPHPKGDAAGHFYGAGNVQLDSARPSPTERNATGHSDDAADGGHHHHARALRPDRDGGQGDRAGNGLTRFASAREPSATDIAAMRRVRQAVAVTVLDTFRVRDGRAIGDITFGELEEMRAENAREASILRQLMRHAANVASDAKVRDIVNAETLQRMIQRGAEVADAA